MVDANIVWYFITPGHFVQSDFAESFNGYVRGELLKEIQCFNTGHSRQTIGTWITA